MLRTEATKPNQRSQTTATNRTTNSIARATVISLMWLRNKPQTPVTAVMRIRLLRNPELETEGFEPSLVGLAAVEGAPGVLSAPAPPASFPTEAISDTHRILRHPIAPELEEVVHVVNIHCGSKKNVIV